MNLNHHATCGCPSSVPTFRMFVIDHLAQEHRRAGRDVISLTLGQSDLPLHPRIVREIQVATSDPVKSNLVCPGGLPELRAALAARYSAIGSRAITSERILIDNGTSSLYPILLRIIGGSGGSLLVPHPYYPLYLVAASLAGAAVNHYGIDLHTMQIDMDSLRASITSDTRAIIVNSPGNPLGNIVTQSELADILSLLPTDAFIILDEIYENMIFGSEFPLAPNLLRGDSDLTQRVIITNSLSKGYRMYTKRVGWCVVPTSLSSQMLAIYQHTRLTVDPCAQYGALEALQNEGEVATVRASHRERWKYAHDTLSGISLLRTLPCRGGFYCTLDCRALCREAAPTSDSALAIDILQKTGVATVPGEDFGLPGHLRLSFTSDRFRDAVCRLAAYFERATLREPPPNLPQRELLRS